MHIDFHMLYIHFAYNLFSHFCLCHPSGSEGTASSPSKFQCHEKKFAMKKISQQE